MSLSQIFTYLSLWSFAGCVIFSVYVILVFRSGLVYSARKADGTMKEKIPLSGFMATGSLLLGFVCLQTAANRISLVSLPITDNLPGLFQLNYTHYFILFLFDTFVIDGWVLSHWRPAFLHLPHEMGKESMKKHMLLSIPVGLAAGLVLSGISSILSYYLILT